MLQADKHAISQHTHTSQTQEDTQACLAAGKRAHAHTNNPLHSYAPPHMRSRRRHACKPAITDAGTQATRLKRIGRLVSRIDKMRDALDDRAEKKVGARMRQRVVSCERCGAGTFARLRTSKRERAQATPTITWNKTGDKAYKQTAIGGAAICALAHNDLQAKS